MLTEELINELKEEYGSKKSTILKYYELIIERYPFVLKDEDKLEKVIVEVISNISSIEAIFNNDDPNMTLKDKKIEYAEAMSKKIDSVVEDYYEYKLGDGYYHYENFAREDYADDYYEGYSR